MPPPHPTTAATALSGVPAGSAAGPAAAAEKKARVDSAAAHASPSVVSPRMATNSAYSNALMPILAAAAPPVADVDVASLLSYQSVLDRAERSSHSEIDELLHAPTTKQRAVAAPFAAQQRGFNKVCSRRSRDACRALRKEEQLRRAAELGLRPDHPDYPRLTPCEDIHFVPVLRPQTQQHLGDCSYLDRCQTQSCPFIHYSIDPIDRHRVVLDAPAPAASAAASNTNGAAASASTGSNGLAAAALMPAAAAVASHVIGPARPPEWICCDIRTLDVSVLGKFDLIMLDPVSGESAQADWACGGRVSCARSFASCCVVFVSVLSPFSVRQRNQQPWRIRMDLPYDTMGDAEMLAMNIAPLQDEGVCCVWVISQSPGADGIAHAGACGEWTVVSAAIVALIGGAVLVVWLMLSSRLGSRPPVSGALGLSTCRPASLGEGGSAVAPASYGSHGSLAQSHKGKAHTHTRQSRWASSSALC